MWRYAARYIFARQPDRRGGNVFVILLFFFSYTRIFVLLYLFTFVLYTVHFEKSAWRFLGSVVFTSVAS